MAKSISTHEEFNAGDADVVFQSSDGVQFRLHRVNLGVVAGAFPGPEFETRGEVVELSEPANVLQILFKAMYPKRQPDLEDVDFSIVVAVAEAAEKYEVFSVMNTCIMILRHNIHDHPLEALLHGTKHDYPNLIDGAAPHMLFSPAFPVADQLPLSWVVPWFKFTEAGKHIIFGKARAYVKEKTYNSSCVNSSMCTACKCAAYVWIDELEKISTRSALFLALRTYQGYSKLPGTCALCSTSCHFLQYIVDVMKTGLESIPKMTHFRHSRPGGDS